MGLSAVQLSPSGRKIALVAHIGCSVGWLGAILTSLVLAVAGLGAWGSDVARGSYLLLEVVGWYTLLPLSLASLLTGLLQGLGTRWGLLRHYWVIAKLAMNLIAVGVLLLYMQTLTFLANAARGAASSREVDGLGNPSPLLHGTAAVVLLLAALVLSVVKPRGLTAYGRRRIAATAGGGVNERYGILR